MTVIRSNFHTHTLFCDGKDSPEALVQAAQALDFDRLGFSGHAASPAEDYAMSSADMEEYRRQIEELKIRCAGKIEILCGVELDLFSDVNGRDFDFSIASAHFIRKDDAYLCVDESVDRERENLELFGGSVENYAAAYYAAVIASVEKHRSDMIGHLDLVTKFCELTGRTLSLEYRDIAETAVETLSRYDIPFEINTGAIARGYRTSPYPSEQLLRCIKKCGGNIVFSSDCHDRQALDCGFEQAARLAADCGFERYTVFGAAGRTYLPL